MCRNSSSVIPRLCNNSLFLWSDLHRAMEAIRVRYLASSVPGRGQRFTRGRESSGDLFCRRVEDFGAAGMTWIDGSSAGRGRIAGGGCDA